MLQQCLYAAQILNRILKPSIIPTHQIFRVFSISALNAAKPMPPRPTVTEDDLEEAFLRGSGPGGQKIASPPFYIDCFFTNLKHIPTGIVVKSQETRSRSQNRKIARRLLAAKLEVIEKGSESRTAVLAEVKKRKKASKDKKAKRKYRKLEGKTENEGKHGDDEGYGDESDDLEADDRRVLDPATGESQHGRPTASWT
ncbi:MAG: hypothetical protein M1835_001353 [Candelina submexicana]|nr:MAG: hypothetical protein M1835_003234 [Candelina submexicana]KAI9789886.1 MAG: hypothetical protein M1835_001353 [Candelina submexicana]